MQLLWGCSDHRDEAVGGHFTVVANFLKDEFQVLLRQAFLRTNVVEDALYTAHAHKVVMNDSRLGNVLFETGGEFLCVAVSENRMNDMSDGGT